jgi:light-regulated signal transduction histidine kinase (bacteriophytochrome)
LKEHTIPSIKSGSAIVRAEHALVPPSEPSASSPSGGVVHNVGQALTTAPQLIFTERREYAFNEQDGHVVQSGQRREFTRCEDEPIHTPGAIQSHGMLIGLDIVEESGSPRYVCRVVSENCEAICKYSPRSLLQLEDFVRIFPVHQRLAFERQARSVISLYAKKSESSEPKVFSISFTDPEGHIFPCWCAMHFLGGDHNLLICEFELEDSPDISEAFLDDSACAPYNSLNSDPRDAAASFVSHFELPDLDRDQIEELEEDGNSTGLVNLMSKIQEQLSLSTSIQDLLDAIVAVTRQLTNFDRAMVYQFDEDHNGTIVAELSDPKVCSDVYRGLHFPASDIPHQARQLYKLNRVRMLFDRLSQSSRLICRNIEDLETPLDLSHSYLRAMSPIHLKYLGNMGVRSTMSIALNYKNNLWGLICCHSYGSTKLRVSFPVRELCYWVGLCASNCLDQLLNAESIRHRDSLISMKIDVEPQVFVSAASNDLLRLFQADFGFLVVKGEARTIGKLSSYHESVTLLRYLYFRNFTTTYASKNISLDFADLAIEPEFAHIAGLLVIPLSNNAGDFIVFFRRNQTKQVHWAGNPNMAKFGPLEPRNSFTAWVETVTGTCKPWADEQRTCTLSNEILRVLTDKYS